MLADLRTYIASDPTALSLIGTVSGNIKIFPEIARAGTRLPFVTYSIIDERSEDTHKPTPTADSLFIDLIELDVFTKSAVEGIKIKDALRSLLSSGTFESGSTRFAHVSWEGANTLYEDASETFRVIITIEIHWITI